MPYENMSLDDYLAAVRSKVQGTKDSDLVFSESPLEFLNKFSSGAGLVGNRCEGNYASGSIFEDAFARHRTSTGHPTCSLDPSSSQPDMPARIT